MLLFGIATLLLSTSSFRTFLQNTFASGATVFADSAVLTVAVIFTLASICGASLVLRKLRGGGSKASGEARRIDVAATAIPKAELTLAEKEAAIFDGADEEQIAMMAEQVILVNERDEVVGHASKKDSHLNSNIRKGMLHRAFSVFIFDKQGRLMMQQRSDDKITFPAFWANSCCSHPLFTPDELDGVSGVKNAARRKIEQELGISPERLPLDCFKFLSRVHYQAESDEVWGEHEVDYILICQPPEDVMPEPNPNEVQNARYFTQAELDAFVRDADANGDLVSPWFRVIYATLVPGWWQALRDGKLDEHVDYHTIHRAGDAPNTDEDGHYSKNGAGVAVADAQGNAGAAASVQARVGDVSLKQGSYGKVKIHKSSKLATLLRPSELAAMLRYKFGAGLGDTPISGSADLEFCDDILTKVSRSFAAVIRQLDDGLKAEIAVFYLVLRALDTIEDDMTSFPTTAAKVAELKAFPDNMQNPEWSLQGVGEGDERRLLERYHAVARVFNSLDAGCQEVIADICRKMADGMAEYVGKEMAQGTDTVEEYELYCHYVAGLVGEGLSRLFALTGFESEQVGQDVALSNSMGLFLQKVNITRDYLEDLVDGRTFWPREIWGHYARDLGDLRLPQHRQAGVQAVNHMVADALQLVPDSLEYLSRLRSPSVFKFCAIPQLMAIATLSELYNNPKVLTGVVKIRKSLSAQIIMDCADMEAVHRWFSHFARDMAGRVDSRDPTAADLRQSLNRITDLTSVRGGAVSAGALGTVANVVAPAAFVLLGAHLMSRSKGRETFLPRLNETYDVTILALMVCCVVYLWAFAGLSMAAPSKADPAVKGSSVAAPSSAGQKVVS